MKLQTALENLEFFAFHGMYPEEKINGAKFIVNLTIHEVEKKSLELNNLDYLVDYEQIYKIIETEMKIPRDFIEDLANSILEKTVQYLQPKNIEISVKITKPNPGGKFGNGAASVTLSKTTFD